MDDGPGLDIARAQQALSRGDRATAEALCRAALDSDPDDVAALALLARLRAGAGDGAGAHRLARRALALAPNVADRREFAGVLSALAARHARDGRGRLAVDCLARAADLACDDAPALLRLGVSLQQLGDTVRAGACYRRVIEIDPTSADAWNNLGTLAQAARDADEALACYRRALELSPGHADATAGVAAVLDWQGRYDEAMALVAPCIEAGEHGIELLVMYGKLARRTGDGPAALATLLPAAERPGAASADLCRLSFVIADILEDAGRHDEAFDWYARGNRLKGARFDRTRHAAAVKRLMRVVTREHLAAAPVNPVSDVRPVFIVGMPRSGTSLVEQILAAHPLVHAGGEMTAMAALLPVIEARTASAYPEALAAIDADALHDLAARYLAAFGAVDDTVVRLTDKMPNNFLHLGLIQRMLPGARIVHCRRDARDVALSCYFQNFAGNAMPFAYDLADLGHYYAGYRQLMAHYARVIDLPMLDVTYETLVARPEQGIRSLLAFLDLPFDAACVDFHRIDRIATTASHAQVRRPVYTDSVQRHRRHSDRLAPFLDALGPDDPVTPQ